MGVPKNPWISAAGWCWICGTDSRSSSCKIAKKSLSNQGIKKDPTKTPIQKGLKHEKE
jgi:hypothetical protein